MTTRQPLSTKALLTEVDYTLLELHQAMQDKDDVLVFELKDRLSELRLDLIEVGHYK
ncbi:hypothetical protein 0305phi8-36p072 [Bacillus phage 0305phi8-36]|uniref:hypothetical protein n=1 Tax=Bacillus phage 0305phi8-36 TaxID=458639 RepID=UPI00015A1FA4|nr:hypothetical protein ST0305phi8-36p072 [Bacillus phage 0305phi8-36]ABS83632.1 hypothetical protein 0305phi8-36p072 [Bacillus phage 0305phi8-36]